MLHLSSAENAVLHCIFLLSPQPTAAKGQWGQEDVPTIAVGNHLAVLAVQRTPTARPHSRYLFPAFRGYSVVKNFRFLLSYL
jgi:hypothetical protein